MTKTVTESAGKKRYKTSKIIGVTIASSGSVLSSVHDGRAFYVPVFEGLLFHYHTHAGNLPVHECIHSDVKSY